MNIPLFECNKCKLSEKNSFLISKTSIHKEEIPKKEKIYTSSGNDNSTDNLEIIDYPYPSHINQDVSFINNESEINKKGEETNETINNESYMRLHELIEEKLNKLYSKLGKENNNINTSSGVLNNEDSITQNKKLLQNLYSNQNNNNAKENNINNNDKIINNKNKNNYTTKKSEQKKKTLVVKYNRNKCMDLKMEKYHAITDRLSTINNLFENKIINTQRQMKEKKIKIKRNFSISKITRNKTNIVKKNNTLIMNKNFNTNNNLYFESFSLNKNKNKNASVSYNNKSKNKSINKSKNKSKNKSINKKRNISLLFKKKIKEILTNNNIDINNKTNIIKIKNKEKLINISKINNNYNNNTNKNKNNEKNK